VSIVAALWVLVAALFLASSAAAITYAPVDTPGPALRVPQSDLANSLQCTDNLASSPKTPVLLVPGTGSNPPHNFGWNWEPALDALGIPWCAVTLPGNGLGDIQTAAEYVVNAIRTMYATAGRRISIIGHSQGGMIPRWPLRFWPDTRAMVDDQIGIAPSNHGTTGAELLCSVSCAAADWQQSDKSEFIKALNSYQETFPGISYTEIYSHTDEIVTPNANDSGSSSLHGGGEITNVAIQDVCPLDSSEHLAIGTQDYVAYDLAIDALEHPGPADPARSKAGDSTICTPLKLMPGINPLTYPADLASALADLATNTATAPAVPAEPPLRCYVTASCPATAAAVKAKCKKRKKRHHRAAESKKRHRRCKKRHKHRWGPRSQRSRWRRRCWRRPPRRPSPTPRPTSRGRR
jgi:triacylglycerol esterase/lipase EstA (alpha/beta hydrolase family)